MLDTFELFQHIYLANGDSFAINGYIHERAAIERVLSKHVVEKVQVG